MNGTWKPMRHMAVEKVTYAMGSVYSGQYAEFPWCVKTSLGTYLDTSLENTQDLNVMLRNQLGERNEHPNL